LNIPQHADPADTTKGRHAPRHLFRSLGIAKGIAERAPRFCASSGIPVRPR
jgi:hypothetical protein